MEVKEVNLMNELMENIKNSPLTRTVFNADGSISSILLIEPNDAEIQEIKESYDVVWVYRKDYSFIEKSDNIEFGFTLYGNTITTSFEDFYKLFMNCNYKVNNKYFSMDVEINLSKLKKHFPDVVLDNNIFEED